MTDKASAIPPVRQRKAKNKKLYRAPPARGKFYGWRVYADSLDTARTWASLKESILNPLAMGCECLAYQVERGRNEASEKRAIHDGVHLQGFISFATATRWTAKFKDHFPPGVSFRGCFSARAAWEYCHKEDTRIAGPFDYGTPPEAKEAGSKPVWDEIREMVKTNATNAEIFAVHAHAANCVKGITALREAFCPPPVDRHVDLYLIWGPPNTGKSWRAKQQFPDYFEAHGALDLRTFSLYRGQKTVIWDAFISSKAELQSIEALIKDPVVAVPVMYGSILSTWTTIVITTNQHPDSMWRGLVNRDSFFLRLKGIYKVDAKQVDDPDQTIDWTQKLVDYTHK